jgi:uncharacterized protein YkwD
MNTQSLGALRPQSLTRGATRPALARLALAALTAALITLGFPGSTIAPASAQAKATSAATTTMLAADTYEQRVQRQINIRRANHGLALLRFASCPDPTAERWSRYLAVNNTFFHQSMTGILDRCDARYAGETLGRGSMSPNRLVTMWMNYPGHRAILLSPRPRRIGIGASPDLNGGWVVAANFIRF